jgi:dihydrofolate reductase
MGEAAAADSLGTRRADWSVKKLMVRRVEMPSISFIVARSRPGNIIGCENKLPWHLRTDLRRFKTLTLGHVIIMGRKTYESIGKTLPGRINIVLSRRPANDRENPMWNLEETALLWARDRENSVFLADIWSIAEGKKDFFVVGGSEVFDMFSNLFEKIYITEVLGEDIEGDAKFEIEFKYPKWDLKKEEFFPKSDFDEYPSRYAVYERRDKTTRYKIFPDFLTSPETRREWIKQNLPRLSSKKLRKREGRPAEMLLFDEILDTG